MRCGCQGWPFAGTFAIILITLLIIFRSPILAVLPLIVLIALVSSTANALIADATKVSGCRRAVRSRRC